MELTLIVSSGTVAPTYANHEPTRAQRPEAAFEEIQSAGNAVCARYAPTPSLANPERPPVCSRSLRGGKDHDAKEAKLGNPKDCACAPVKRHGSDSVYSWDWAQSPRALHRHVARRTGKGSPRSALSHCPRSLRRSRGSKQNAGKEFVWRQAATVVGN